MWAFVDTIHIAIGVLALLNTHAATAKGSLSRARGDTHVVVYLLCILTLYTPSVAADFLINLMFPAALNAFLSLCVYVHVVFFTVRNTT